ncbi:unnamed protein product [Closterium sp. NIES-54]
MAGGTITVSGGGHGPSVATIAALAAAATAVGLSLVGLRGLRQWAKRAQKCAPPSGGRRALSWRSVFTSEKHGGAERERERVAHLVPLVERSASSGKVKRIERFGEYVAPTYRASSRHIIPVSQPTVRLRLPSSLPIPHPSLSPFPLPFLSFPRPLRPLGLPTDLAAVALLAQAADDYVRGDKSTSDKSRANLLALVAQAGGGRAEGEAEAEAGAGEQLGEELIAELDACMLSYFGFHWPHSALMIEQVFRGPSSKLHLRDAVNAVIRPQSGAAQHSTAQHSTAPHSTTQHSTAQHSTAQHSTAQHSTLLLRCQPTALHSHPSQPAQLSIILSVNPPCPPPTLLLSLPPLPSPCSQRRFNEAITCLRPQQRFLSPPHSTHLSPTQHPPTHPSLPAPPSSQRRFNEAIMCLRPQQRFSQLLEEMKVLGCGPRPGGAGGVGGGGGGVEQRGAGQGEGGHGGASEGGKGLEGRYSAECSEAAGRDGPESDVHIKNGVRPKSTRDPHPLPEGDNLTAHSPSHSLFQFPTSSPSRSPSHSPSHARSPSRPRPSSAEVPREGEVMVPAAAAVRCPVLLLIGGGMGAGKSTVVKEIMKRELVPSPVLLPIGGVMGAGKSTVVKEIMKRRGHGRQKMDIMERAQSSERFPVLLSPLPSPPSFSPLFPLSKHLLGAHGSTHSGSRSRRLQAKGRSLPSALRSPLPSSPILASPSPPHSSPHRSTFWARMAPHAVVVEADAFKEKDAIFRALSTSLLPDLPFSRLLPKPIPPPPRSTFWARMAPHAVVVEADAFKEKDAIFRALSADRLSDAARISQLVHEESTRAAQSTLVTALNEGRDVIFDGTMSWAPFVQQTISMARRVHETRFRMGPGYQVKEDGSVVERYWEEVEEGREGGVEEEVEEEGRGRRGGREEVEEEGREGGGGGGGEGEEERRMEKAGKEGQHRPKRHSSPRRVLGSGRGSSCRSEKGQGQGKGKGDVERIKGMQQGGGMCWERRGQWGGDEHRLPYRIELVGVMCDAHLAVVRGMRSAPTTPPSTPTGMITPPTSTPPSTGAICSGGVCTHLLVDSAAFHLVSHLKRVNPRASCVLELYFKEGEGDGDGDGDGDGEGERGGRKSHWWLPGWWLSLWGWGNRAVWAGGEKFGPGSTWREVVLAEERAARQARLREAFTELQACLWPAAHSNRGITSSTSFTSLQSLPSVPSSLTSSPHHPPPPHPPSTSSSSISASSSSASLARRVDSTERNDSAENPVHSTEHNGLAANPINSPATEDPKQQPIGPEQSLQTKPDGTVGDRHEDAGQQGTYRCPVVLGSPELEPEPRASAPVASETGSAVRASDKPVSYN